MAYFVMQTDAGRVFQELAGKFLKISATKLPAPKFIGPIVSATDSLLMAIGALVKKDIQDRIETEKRTPEGGSWPAWTPQYARTRGPGDSLLLRSDSKERPDSLFNSIDTVLVGGNEVSIGTDIIYGEIQDARREFIGVDDEAEGQIVDIVSASVVQMIEEAFS